jgi:hypothetical protein
MPTIDDRTTNLSLAKPNVANTLQADVARLRSALDAIDAELVALDNSNIAAGAEIAVSKLADGAARQVLQTDAAGTGVEWTSNVDLPGTLDVTGVATFDSAVTVPLGTAGAPALRPVGSSTTGLFYPDTSTVAVSTGGVGCLYVDSSQRVGVGATPSTAAVSTRRDLQLTNTRFVAVYYTTTDSSTDAKSWRTISRWSGSAFGSVFDIQTVNDADSSESTGIRLVRTTGAATVDNVQIHTAGAERARLTSTGNFKIGGTANRATTEGTNQLVMFNGTAPVGTLTNGVSLYSASGECRVMDAAGNSTLLSPHDRETNEWIYDSTDTTTGKRLRIDMEKMMKFLDAHFGLGFVQETFTT